MTARLALICVGIAGMFLSGCTKQATGQVVAIVDGEEITIAEVNAELAATGVADGAGEAELRRAALRRIVDRKLLAQVAREQDIDQTPDYLLRRRRLDEVLLVQSLATKATGSAGMPGDREVQRYIRDRPHLFGQHAVYLLDRLTLARAPDPPGRRLLGQQADMAAVVATLRRLGIGFARQSIELDTGTMDPLLRDRLARLPPGQPLVGAEAGRVNVTAVIARRAAPVLGASASARAIKLLREERLAQAMRATLERARAAATIAYQPGFGQRR